MRNDIRCPSQIVSSDYTEVAIWTMNIQGFGDAEFMLREREIIRKHMAQTNGTYAHVETTGSCQVCGNVQAIYLVLFYHEKSNTYIRVGMDCTVKLGMSADHGKMNLFRKNLANAREAQAGKRKAIAILSDLGLMFGWEIYTAEYPKHADTCLFLSGYQFDDPCNCGAREQEKTFGQFEERTIRDIVGKLIRYGSISEKQSEFISKLIGKILDRPIIDQQREAEKLAAGPVPVGRVEMSGEVVGMKTVQGASFSYGDDGIRTKLIIKLANGSKVYGNRFANLEKGQTVRFTATVEASKDDIKFGFFSRARLWTPKVKTARKNEIYAYA